jgi:hypothetical protein
LGRMTPWRLSLLMALSLGGCVKSNLQQSVIVDTGRARSVDGYEAAVAAAEAGGYPIVVKDPKHSFVRIRSRLSGVPPSDASVYLDVKAWSGAVDVRVTTSPGLVLADSQQDQLRAERRDLLWSIASRARLIAGEPMGPSGTDPPDRLALPWFTPTGRSTP